MCSPAGRIQRTARYNRDVADRQRLNPRLEIELPAEYRVDRSDEPKLGMIANLSVGGAAVMTKRQLPPHSILDQFRFALPGEDGTRTTLEASAVVVHARPYLNDLGTIEYFSGLHFLGLEDSNFKHLRAFVQSRLGTDED